VKNLTLLEPTDAPEESAQLERDGYASLRGVFDPAEVARMREEIEAEIPRAEVLIHAEPETSLREPDEGAGGPYRSG